MLVGNPNVGKSVIFGVLTGRYATVSNYPGTTVELTHGRMRGGESLLVDLPGTNSLLPESEDEQVTRDVLMTMLDRPHARVVQVFDTKNLRRGLFLTLQLLELETPLVLVANMTDEARSRGWHLDGAALGAQLGVTLLETIATQRNGFAQLMSGQAEFRVPRAHRVGYPAPVEAALTRVEELLPETMRGRRGLALMLLAEDGPWPQWAETLDSGDMRNRVAEIRAGLNRRLHEPLRFVINRTRQAAADRMARNFLTREKTQLRGWPAQLGSLALHPLWGLPIAAAVLYGIYLFVGVLGAGTAVDFLENAIFAGWVVPWLDSALRWALPEGTWELLIGPAGTEPGAGGGLLLGDYGLISMGLSYAFAIVLPIVGFFFIAFSILEDSGYLPRLAVMLNRVFRAIGLNGKAVLPMILGLGCDTMATMTARILSTPKERIIVTLLLALGVPCSAQLGVILGMMAALSGWAMLWWLGTVIGVMAMVGWLANRVLPGQGSDFVLEIPPLRVPALGNIAIKTLARIEWYLREVVPLFLLGTFLLWVLNRVDALAALERGVAPLVQGWLGLPAKATEAFLIGFLRRDYGAAGLFALFQDSLSAGEVSQLVEIQVVVSLVTITLFVPCIANFLMIVKERGLATALWMTAFIFPFAFLVGGLLNQLMRLLLL